MRTLHCSGIPWFVKNVQILKKTAQATTVLNKVSTDHSCRVETELTDGHEAEI